MVHAALDGAFDRARERHHELGPLFRALFWESNPIPLKEALSIRGHVAGNLRAPLSALAVEHRDALETVLADLDASAERSDRPVPEAER